MISIIYERSRAQCSVLEACRLRFSGGPPQLVSLAQTKEKPPYDIISSYILNYIVMIKTYIIYVKNKNDLSNVSRKFKIQRFRNEIDRKNGSILAIILPARFEKHVNSIKKPYLFQDHFSQKCFLSNTVHLS